MIQKAFESEFEKGFEIKGKEKEKNPPSPSFGPKAQTLSTYSPSVLDSPALFPARPQPTFSA
jgi:hypothetical protein